MLTELISITTQKANPTDHTMQKVKQFLEYEATHPDAIIIYNASDIVLAGHSNASYLSEKKARRRSGGNLFMLNDTEFPPQNEAVLTIAKIIKAAMTSASEDELGALFINYKESITELQALQEMGHTNPPT